jgi:sensor histidine kinase YesM
MCLIHRLPEFWNESVDEKMNKRFAFQAQVKDWIKKNLSIYKSQFTQNVFVPLFILLTVIALVNSLQAVRITKGKATLDIFLNFWMSKTIYCWYYLFLAVLIQQLSIRVHRNRTTLWKWFTIHGIALVGAISFHQLLSLWVDLLIWKGKMNVSYSDLLLKNISVWLDVSVYVLFILSFYMIEFRRSNQENEMRCLQLEAQLLRAQLQELRSVIRPQFLFATLQSIEELLDKHQNREANRLLSGLSSVLRTTVYENDSDERTLEKELHYLREYLAIENVRFPNGVTMIEEIEKGISHAMIPNFVLQPLVERCIEHALSHAFSSSTIRITGKRHFQQLVLCVEEDATNDMKSEKEQQYDDAVCNIVVDRLNHLYHEKQCFQLTRTAAGTMTIQVQIPFREQPQAATPSVVLENSL